MPVFHTSLLTKEQAIALARSLGLRRDWARVKLAEIQTALRGFPAQTLVDAANRISDEFTRAEWLELTDVTKSFANDVVVADAEIVDVTPKPVTVAAAPALPAPKTPDVSQVATLLAQLLATGKAGLDKNEVEGIVSPMLSTHGEQLMSAVADKINAAVHSIAPREIIVKSERGEVKIDGRQHKDFQLLLDCCAATSPDGHHMNVWMYGPPGTGKTTAAMNVAKALNMSFFCNGALSTKYELTGFVDAGGKVIRTPFRDAWEKGGVYLFDEIDGSDPRAVVAFNAALANGIMAFPDGMIERHKDAIMIAASNTVHGATSEFTGRMKLDAATIDRFIMLEWAIDEELEASMTTHKTWVRTVQSFRAKVKTKGVKVAITPRATIYGDALLQQGMNIETVKRIVLRKAMTDEQWKILEA